MFPFFTRILIIYPFHLLISKSMANLTLTIPKRLIGIYSSPILNSFAKGKKSKAQSTITIAPAGRLKPNRWVPAKY